MMAGGCDSSCVILNVRGNMSLCSGKFNVELTDWAVARGSTSSNAEDSRSEYSE